MQSIIYTNISKGDLLYLFGIGQDVLNRWLKAGLFCEPDGRFSLSKVCRWVKEYYQEKDRQNIKPDSLDQYQLSALLAVTRQTVTAWGRANLPRKKDGSYNLQKVCCWLRLYYRRCAEREYQQRLETIRKRINKNVKQIEKFLD